MLLSVGNKVVIIINSQQVVKLWMFVVYTHQFANCIVIYKLEST